MDIIDFFKKNKFIISISLLLILSAFYSINTHLYVYDGHHHGLMFSNAKDLLEGKTPYKEIFIQYGFLTTILHAFSIRLFGELILSINILTILAYSFGVLFLSLTVAKYTNYFYSLICTILLLSHHPIAWLPWSNYLAFFFLSAAIYALHFDNMRYQFVSGLFLGFASLSRENYVIFILLSLFLTSICIWLINFNNKKVLYKKISFIFSGFLLPIICFFFYLIINKIFFYWTDYLILPSLYLESYNTGVFALIINYIIFFLTNAFYQFINDPQYLLISIILISNTILLLHHLFVAKNKNLNLILLLFLSIFSSVVSLGIELFRLYTSVIVGVVPFFYLISNIKDFEYKNICLTVIFFLSVFCIIFYPTGNYKTFKNLNKKESQVFNEISYFKHQKWEDYKINPLKQVYNIKEKIIKNCNIKYFANLSFDTFYSTIFELENLIIFSGIRSDSLKNDLIFNHFDKSRNILKKINEESSKNNLILLISENNYYIGKNRIDINYPYVNKEIQLSKNIEKPKILRIYYPRNCLN